MRWANFIHIYQPADQQPDILQAVVAQSYRPILEGIEANKNIRLTFNVNGALLELFDKYGHRDLIDILRRAGQEEKIEFTGCAKYHALLPFLSEKEAIRQIEINNEINKFYLGDAYKPKGFFPPEMAYKPEMAPLIESLGFKWIILDEIAFNGETDQVQYDKIYRIKNTKLGVFFRERRLSNMIMSAVVRSEKSIIEAVGDKLKSDRYWLTAMDGETFGHHRPGLEKMLLEIFQSSDIELIQVSDIPKYFKEEIEIEPIKSTWASSQDDIRKGIQFLSWRDPENQIHKWQWELVDLALNEFYKIKEKDNGYQNIRSKIDNALASDHFWWASAKPWWSLEMIELGAYRLLDAIRSIPNISGDVLNTAVNYYQNIVSTAFDWQRTGKIRKMMQEQNQILRIPFKDRTVGEGGVEAGVYYAFVDMMKNLEKKAAENGEYEKAILWRDALFKLENKQDIYEAINAVDLLRVEIPNAEVEEMVQKYKEKYKQIRGGQPEQRGS